MVRWKAGTQTLVEGSRYVDGQNEECGIKEAEDTAEPDCAGPCRTVGGFGSLSQEQWEAFEHLP